MNYIKKRIARISLAMLLYAGVAFGGESDAGRVDLWLYPSVFELPAGYEHLLGPVLNIEIGIEAEERFRLSWMIIGPEVIGDQYEFIIDTPAASINDDFYHDLELGSYWGCVELEWLNADGEWEVIAVDYIEFDVIDALDYFGA